MMREDLVRVRFYKDGQWSYEDLTLSSAATLLADLKQIFAEQTLAEQESQASHLRVLVE